MLSLYKNYLAIGLLASLAISFPLQPVWAVDGIAASGPAALSKLQAGSKIQCPPNDANCQKCSQALPGIYSRTKSAVDAAVAKDGASAASGAAGAKGAGNAANGAQENSASMGSLGAGLGAGGLTGRAGASGEAATAFNKCVSDIDQSCSGVAQADKAKQACQEGATAAGQSAADQGKGAGDMSQLASMLGQMAQALGPLMAQKDQPQSSVTPPETTTPAKLPQVAGTSLSSDKDAKGGQIGFGNSGSAKSEDKVAGSGENHQGFGRINSDPALASSLGGSSTEGGFNSSGASIGSAQPSGGAAGLGAGDSSGASMMGEVPAAPKAAEAGGNEYPSGSGGGSRPSFLGLKGKSEAEPGAEGDGPLGGLGLEEGNRELASSEENAAGIHPEEMGGSLFNVVHTKYVEIKQKGNI